MPARKGTERYAKVTVKDCWHPYGLQGLAPEKFANIASLILKGKFALLGVRYDKTIEARWPIQ